jgi:hypothetical protein
MALARSASAVEWDIRSLRERAIARTRSCRRRVFDTTRPRTPFFFCIVLLHGLAIIKVER